MTQDNLDWCCGDNKVFKGVIEAFIFVPSKQLQHTIEHQKLITLNVLPVGESVHANGSAHVESHENKHPIMWPNGENQSSWCLENVSNCLFYLGDGNGCEVMKRTVDAPPELVTDTFVKLELQKLKCQINNVKGTVIDFEPFNDVPMCGPIKKSECANAWSKKKSTNCCAERMDH